MKKILLPFFLLGTIVMIVVMAKTGATLKPATAHGILDLEFAYNTTKTAAVLKAWAPANGLDNIAVAKTNTRWDFVFLFFYAGFLFLASNKIAANTNGVFSRAGKAIAWGALWAGFLDILENAGMLLTLSNQGSNTIAFATTFISVIKWVLAIIAVLYVLAGLLVLALRKKN